MSQMNSSGQYIDARVQYRPDLSSRSVLMQATKWRVSYLTILGIDKCDGKILITASEEKESDDETGV